jgi:Tol biopolymer transport system component
MARLLLLLVVAAAPLGVYAVRMADGDSANRGAETSRRDPEAANLYHLYLLELADETPRAVPDPRENPYLTFDPAWSPDGKQLAVTETDCHQCPPEVRLVTLDQTGAPRRKLAPGSQPTIAPDGRSVAFVPADGGLAVVGIDGQGRRTLFEDKDGSVNRPRFSPDGRLIAFMRQDRAGRWHVWTSRPDGSGARQLTNGERPEADPAWSGDGRMIAFARQADDGLWHLHVVPRSGGAARMITGKTTSDSHPSFAPDGSWMVFVRQEGARFFLVRQTLSNGQTEPLELGQLRDAAEPAVAPDGRTIAFVARRPAPTG